MKILVVSDLPQFVIGGAEKQAELLIRAWLENGHEVICAGRRMKDGFIMLDSRPLPICKIRSRGSHRVIRALTYFLSLSWLIVKMRPRPDVIYTRFLGEAAMTVALLKRLRLCRAVLVATPAGSGPIGDVAFIQRLPGAGAVKRLLETECDAINIIAPVIETELVGSGFRPSTFSRISNGIPIKNLERSDALNKHLLAISVGRLSSEKGLDILLRALAMLAPNIRPALHIAGDGPERTNLEMLTSELKLSSHVNFLGNLSSECIRSELQTADIFVLPSFSEGMSNAALEAMERGLPLILTRCGGLDSFIEQHAGWVVPPHDISALAVALADANSMDRSALASKGKHARALAIRMFALDKVAMRYLNLFEHLLESARQSQGHA